MFSGGTASLVGSNDGFFSQVKEAFGEGISTIGRDLLPIWAAGQLEEQSRSRLDQPTYNSNGKGARRRIDDGQRSTNDPIGSSLPPPSSNLVWWVAGAVGLVLVGALLLRGR